MRDDEWTEETQKPESSRGFCTTSKDERPSEPTRSRPARHAWAAKNGMLIHYGLWDKNERYSTSRTVLYPPLINRSDVAYVKDREAGDIKGNRRASF